MFSKIIDTHVHVWNFEKADYTWLKEDSSILNRSYHIEELEQPRQEACISEGVLVQAANNADDTAWMLEVAEQNDWITGVVGWLPLLNPEQATRSLQDKYLKNKYFKGVRHLIHTEPDAQWLLKSEVMESLKILAKLGLPFDVVGILPSHLKTALKLADQIPELRMVFDHLNRPPLQEGIDNSEWANLMQEASQHTNFFVKISGLGILTSDSKNWESKDIQPAIEFILKTFGPERCFCGGDWPVSLLGGSYVKTWEHYKSTVSKILNEPEQDAIFFKNAKLFYDL